MIITPAIDIRKGKVVRLFRGLYNKETVYSQNPLAVAQQWKQEGAEILHIIDLDGAFYGEPRNVESIEQIIATVNVKVHVGGGIRSIESIERLLAKGVHRVIMSTKVFEDVTFLKSLKKNIRSKIIVSIDSKSGLVLDKGWTRQTALSVPEAVKLVEDSGINLAVITDVSTDGTLAGPNTALLSSVLAKTSINIITAGGISGIEDIKTLRRLKNDHDNLYGVIIGKALYEGNFTLKEALRYAQ
jgi:phosphoribosylformimino-5-aminoimidazole carboxamide ribotide isomerase